MFLAPMAIQGAPLKAEKPIVIPGGAGSFDFMNVDSKDRLGFACHPGKDSFTVINLDTDKVEEVNCGLKVNGIDADPATQSVFAAGPGNMLVRYDIKTWQKTGSLPLSGPGDSVIADSKRGVVYVDNDDGTSLWIVNAKNLKIISTVTIKEAPEVMAYDIARKKIFQNIKTTNSLQVIDVTSKKVVDEFKLGSLTSPHGLAEDFSTGKLFSVGKNGKLVILSADSGTILSEVDVNKNSDQIAYDETLKRLYIPGGGMLQVVQITSNGAKVLGSTPIGKGCHSVTVDPATHNVWIAYADSTNSYAQKFLAK